MFENIKNDIIIQLQSDDCVGKDMTDIGNYIGIAIAKYVNQNEAYIKAISLSDFITGLDHGIELHQINTRKL